MDPRQAVAVLIAYVNSGELAVPDTVRAAALTFARACQTLNDRLASCDALLKINQRSEAVRQAKLQPDVLDQYAALEMPDRDRWAETARHLGLPIPPRPDAQAARRLHAAFTTDQTVGVLLQQYRFLAVSRAPLRQRLDVLRLLVRAEPTNFGWLADVRAHEAARLTEIRNALDDRSRVEDGNFIRALEEELRGGWTSPVPLEIVGLLRQASVEFRRRAGQEVLRRLNPRLLRAIRADDFDQVKELHAQIGSAAEQHGVALSSRAMAVFHEADAWLDAERKRRKREKAFWRIVEALRIALDETSDWEYVRHYYSQLRQFPELEIPEDISERYAAWARSRRLWAAGIAAAVLVALSGLMISLMFFRN